MRGRGDAATRRDAQSTYLSPRPRVAASLRRFLPFAFSRLWFQPHICRDFAQRGDDEIDVLTEFNRELLRAFIDFITIDGAREGFVFELLLHRLRFQIPDAVGSHE